MFDFQEVVNTDPILAEAMQQELGRQRGTVELIASENFVSKAVMAAMGSPLTNKYAEGYHLCRCSREPGHRARQGTVWR